jgi:CysZ protein
VKDSAAEHNAESKVSRLTPSPFYVLLGAGFLLKNRVLWKYAAAPIAITMALFGISYYFLYTFLTDMARSLIGEQGYWQILYYIVIFVVAVLILGVFFVLFTLVATTLAAPFNDLISEKTEQIVTGRLSDAPFSIVQTLKDVSRGLWHTVRILLMYIGLLVLCLILLLIPGLGAVAYPVAAALLGAFMLSFEYLSYPMDRRRLSFQQKMGFVRSRLSSTLGFGLGSFAAAAVPIVNLLIIPAAVVGGTLLFLDLGGDDRIRRLDEK